MQIEHYQPISQQFYTFSAPIVARRLLNCLLIRNENKGRIIGRICDTEAYTQDDPASHSFTGKTCRNSVMFGPAGHAYVYYTYGMHHCFNVVTGMEGSGEAVLIRAVEPIEGMEQMIGRRGPSREVANRRNYLCGGPGRVCVALGIDHSINGWKLYEISQLYIASPAQKLEQDEIQIVSSSRIGITKNVEPLWRFTLKNDPYISRPLRKSNSAMNRDE